MKNYERLRDKGFADHVCAEHPRTTKTKGYNPHCAAAHETHGPNRALLARKGVTQPRRFMQKKFRTQIERMCSILDTLLEHDLQSLRQRHWIRGAIRQHSGSFLRLSGVVPKCTDAACVQLVEFLLVHRGPPLTIAKPSCALAPASICSHWHNSARIAKTDEGTEEPEYDAEKCTCQAKSGSRHLKTTEA